MVCTIISNFNYKLFVSSLLFPIFAVNLDGQAQYWHLMDSIPLPPPHSITRDLTGRLYLADQQGAVVQLNAEGDSLREYRPASSESPTLLPWQLLRIQAFYPFQQVLRVLDQNLAEVSSYSLPETSVTNACLSADQHLWYIDSDGVLNKYQPILEQTVLSASLQWYISTQSKMRGLQEYQNRLYIHADDEVIVFDLYGNYLTRLPISALNTFRFFQEELYFFTRKDIIFFNLYTQISRQVPLPEKVKPIEILVGDKLLYVFTDQYLYIYSGQIAL